MRSPIESDIEMENEEDNNTTKPLYMNRLILSFLHCRDHISMRFVSSAWRKQCDFFGSYWKKGCNAFFCSSFTNYQHIFNYNAYLNTIPRSAEPPNDYIFIEVPNKTLLNVWKEMFINGLRITKQWEDLISNSPPCDFFGSLDYDCQSIHLFYQDLYSNLKDCSPFSNLRTVIALFENDLNTPLQTYLYGRLLKEKYIYQLKDMNSKYTFQLPNQPFWNLSRNLHIEEFRSIPKNEEALKRMRFYQEASIELKDSSVLYMMSLVHKAVIHHCELARQYIGEITNPEEMIREYVIRYKNFTAAALTLDDKYTNVNIIINNLSHYDSPCRYSLLRLFIETWKAKCLAPLEELLGHQIQILLRTQLRFELSNKVKRFVKEYTQDPNQMDCDEESDCSYYNLLAHFYSAINDSFCNEYNIFQINLSEIKGNKTFNNFTNLLLTEIKVSLTEILKRFPDMTYTGKLSEIITELYNYFSINYRFIEQFIPVVKRSIVIVVSSTLNEIMAHHKKQKEEALNDISEDNNAYNSNSNANNDHDADSNGSTLDNSFRSDISYDTEDNTSITLKNTQRQLNYESCIAEKINYWSSKQVHSIIIVDKKVQKGLEKNGLLFNVNTEDHQ